MVQKLLNKSTTTCCSAWGELPVEGLVLWGPQGSLLGQLFFLIFINDIVSDIGFNICLLPDETSMYLVVENPNIAAVTLQSDIVKVSNWADRWHVDFNPSKTDINPHPSLYMNGVQVKAKVIIIIYLNVLFIITYILPFSTNFVKSLVVSACKLLFGDVSQSF
mgnify:CR=1 FL=1